tara:strand:+ start:3761 stop:4687 length:927 start_codon:yes stop_codon:yes gene_type:complete
MKKFKVYIITFIITFFPALAIGKIEIKYKIGEQIITNIDILNEKNYLLFLRPDLKNISNKEIIEIAENSLIREIIKKKELKKIFKNDNNSKFLEEVKKNLFAFKGVNNEEELKKIINKNNIEYDEIIEKIKYESLWNELIYKKYISYVKVDRENLKQKLQLKMSKDKKYEYNLSEILFDVDSNENLKNKYELILEYIKKNNFKAAAARYSISNSSNKGGLIGWIKETLLSNEINIILSKMGSDEISKSIRYPNGYLILKINEKRIMKQIVNIDKELDDLYKFETNKQLNQFSLLFFKKLKQNTVINEY